LQEEIIEEKDLTFLGVLKSIGIEKSMPYDPSKHQIEQITGSGFIFQGLFKSNVVLGVNIRAGLSFEFGTFKSNVSGFEIGMLLDAYTRKINMIPEADNYAVWPTVYITLFYGSRK
jgi:hypothetical protein